MQPTCLLSVYIGRQLAHLTYARSLFPEVVSLEDNQILDMYFARQEAAINETRQKYGARLYKTAVNILHNNEDAEECVSDTLMKAWEAIPPSRPTMFGAFLAKITRNVSLNKWEAKGAKKRGSGEVNLLLSELEECLASINGQPEKEYEAQLVTEAINNFLGTLSMTSRVAFVLRYFHGESINAISERFHVSESKVKSMLFRTRNKLRVHLIKEGVSV